LLKQKIPPAKVLRLPNGIFFGAEDEARTRDLNLGKVALYQLSYFRIEYDTERTSLAHPPDHCAGTRFLIGAAKIRQCKFPEKFFLRKIIGRSYLY
jgi:hypothetical protein